VADVLRRVRTSRRATYQGASPHRATQRRSGYAAQHGSGYAAQCRSGYAAQHRSGYA